MAGKTPAKGPARSMKGYSTMKSKSASTAKKGKQGGKGKNC